MGMTATASQAEQILEAVAKAAGAVSQAAVALNEANEQSRAQRSGFSEASKVVKTPSAFGNANSAEDQAYWLDFSFSFKQWFFYAEPGYEADFKHVEDHLNTPVIYNASAGGVKSMERSKPVYAILSAASTVETVEAGARKQWTGSLEATMYLVYARTKSGALGLLSALMSHPPFSRERTIHEQRQGVDRTADEHRKSSGPDVKRRHLVDNSGQSVAETTPAAHPVEPLRNINLW